MNGVHVYIFFGAKYQNPRLLKRYRVARSKLRISEAFVCKIRYFGQSATIKMTHVFMVAGRWVTVDFDSL